MTVLTRTGNRPVIDTWSAFDYKEAYKTGVRPATAPLWVRAEDMRRLRAYMMLEAYCSNAARDWTTGADESVKAKRREYGDPKTVVNTVLASLMGDDQSVTCDEADGENVQTGAEQQLTLVRKWGEKEGLIKKMIETERNAVKLGDGVYALSWDAKKKRPRLRCYDPGFYFPVWDDDRAEDEGFPFKIHICWEYERARPGDPKTKDVFVRRLTWELIETVDAAGNDLEINYPWNDGPTNLTCLFSDGTWRVDEYQINKNLEPEGGVYEVRDLDLGIDFIPVIHMPNSVAEQEHWGTSTLENVLQIFDDLQSTDTDLQASSATTGSPPIALNGATAPKDSEGHITSYGPGTVLETGDGTATVIDTSNSLLALTGYDDKLLSRLSVNGRIPESLLGRIKPSEVPSGIALTLSFAPHTSMIKEMRLIRKEKYRLLFRFVSRFFLLDGQLTGTLYELDMHFGSFLPADRQETVTIVTQAIAAKIMSRSTGVRMLAEAGIPIEDILEELDAIRSEDFGGANELLDATGNTQAVGKYLGVKVEEPERLQPDPAAERAAADEPEDE